MSHFHGAFWEICCSSSLHHTDPGTGQPAEVFLKKERRRRRRRRRRKRRRKRRRSKRRMKSGRKRKWRWSLGRRKR